MLHTSLCVASNTDDSLRRSHSPSISAESSESGRAININKVAVRSQSVKVGNESGNAQDVVGWDDGSVKRDVELIESSLVWIRAIELNDDGRWWWGRWWRACCAGDGDYGLGRTDDPCVGWSFDESGRIVDSVECALGGDVDAGGRDGGD